MSTYYVNSSKSVSIISGVVLISRKENRCLAVDNISDQDNSYEYNWTLVETLYSLYVRYFSHIAPFSLRTFEERLAHLNLKLNSNE
jgi:hypothetical protein